MRHHPAETHTASAVPTILQRQRRTAWCVRCAVLRSAAPCAMLCLCVAVAGVWFWFFFVQAGRAAGGRGDARVGVGWGGVGFCVRAGRGVLSSVVAASHAVRLALAHSSTVPSWPACCAGCTPVALSADRPIPTRLVTRMLPHAPPSFAQLYADAERQIHPEQLRFPKP